jgi:hypothetical protein
MAGLGDSLTIGLLLLIVFGAVCFYLYSRLSQNEKRVSLLENLLLSLKMNTEASLMGVEGPDSVEPVSSPAPLESNDVDEEEYSEMLQNIPQTSQTPSTPRVPTPTAPAPEEEDDELLRAVAEVPVQNARKMDANYESMSLKELETLAKQRGITGVPKRKRDLIDALKKQGEAPPEAPVPMDSAPAELEEGFNVEINA